MNKWAHSTRIRESLTHSIHQIDVKYRKATQERNILAHSIRRKHPKYREEE